MTAPVPSQGPGARTQGLFIGLLVLLVWLPLPLGSNRWWAVAIMQGAIAVLGLLWLARARRAPQLVRARPVLVLFALWLGYGLLQLLPWPRPLVGILAPGVLAAFDAAGVTASWLPLTVDWAGSLALWFQGLALVTLFLLLLVLVDSRHRLRMLANVLLLAAVAQAMVASLAALSGVGWWFIEARPQAHGTYPNRNHLAGFLVMNLSIGIGLLLADLEAHPPAGHWRARLRDLSRMLLGATARRRIWLAILVVTLVLTSSRMGNLALFGSLFLAGAMGVLLYRRRARTVAVLLASLVLIDVLILGAWFGLERVQQRLAATTITEETRWQVGVLAVPYVEDFALTGSGGGSFAVVFPGYRDAALAPYHYPHAENDYLEFLLEYGIIGLGLLAAAVLLTLATALAVLARRRDPLARGMAFAGLMGVLGALIHASADFNLRIPANAALFMVLLALPWIAVALPRRPGDRAPAEFHEDAMDHEQGHEAQEQRLLGNAKVGREQTEGSE